MNLKRYEWMKSIMEAIKTAKIDFESVEVTDYSTELRLTLKMKSDLPEKKK